MQKMEFFHNVVCGHCFIMSHRLKEVLKAYPEAEIIHRSFPLNWEDTASHVIETEHNQKVKQRKWEMANRIDDLSRFNVEKIQKVNFEMPTSMRAQLAIRSAVRLGEDPWVWFDLFQSALFEDVRDISNEKVIFDLVKQTSINFDNWLTMYRDPKTLELEQDDFNQVNHYNIELIPAVVVNNEVVIEGTKRTDLAQRLIEEAFKQTKKTESN